MTKIDNNIKIILGDSMITKEKKKIFVGMIIILLLLIIYIIYNIYSNKIVSYASNDNVDIQISNAQKVDIENIIKQKQQREKYWGKN